MAILRSLERKTRFLCTRELQNSIRESVHQTLVSQIKAMGVHGYFEIGETFIRNDLGSEFIFRGLRGMHNNAVSLKSYEDIDVCWIEEAQTVSEASFVTLIPTIRKAGSEMWVTFNPDLATDPVYRRFVEVERPGAIVRKVNWDSNPWMPERSAEERRWMLRTDPDAHAWVWGGECRSASDAQILRGKWRVESFEPLKTWDGPYYGADWGFATDPSALVKVWLHNSSLYVEYEAWQVGCDIDKTPALFACVPGSQNHVVRADSSRPETISHMQQHGFPRMQAARKWPGSVEDGISWMRGCESIVIHERCKHTADEARLYSYKVDARSGDVLPDIVDKHNHLIDAIRYACQPMIAARAKPPVTLKVASL